MSEQDKQLFKQKGCDPLMFTQMQVYISSMVSLHLDCKLIVSWLRFVHLKAVIQEKELREIIQPVRLLLG